MSRVPHWAHRRRVTLSLTHAARERICGVAESLDITTDAAADALIRALGSNEADRAVLQVLADDQRSREEP